MVMVSPGHHWVGCHRRPSGGSGKFEIPILRPTPKTREDAVPASSVPASRTTPATFSLPDEREMLVPHRLSSGSRGVNLQMRWLAREESLAMEADSPMSSLASPAPAQKDKSNSDVKEPPSRNSKAKVNGAQATGVPANQGRQLSFTRRSARKSAREQESSPDSPGLATVVGDLTKSITNMFSFGRSS